MEKLPGEGEEKEKEGEGERKAECGGGKKARRVIEESFSGMSTPSSTVTVSKKRESTRYTVETGRL